MRHYASRLIIARALIVGCGHKKRHVTHATVVDIACRSNAALHTQKRAISCRKQYEVENNIFVLQRKLTPLVTWAYKLVCQTTVDSAQSRVCNNGRRE